MPAALSSQARRRALAGFEHFWDVYPLPVDPLTAEEAWCEALDVADPATILAGAERYAERYADEGGRFVLTPARWLAERRWEDELAALALDEED